MHSLAQSPCDEAVLRAGDESTACDARTGRWVLAAAILGSSITFIDGTVVNVALPVLQRELGASAAGVQWIFEAYALMVAALILVGGSLGDRLGRRRVFAAGVVVFALASIWCGLANGIGQLVAARAVQGVGAAFLIPGSLALISAYFPKKTRGRAIGTWSGVTAIAAGAGPVLGGWLVESVSWRWIFYVNIPLAAIVLTIVALRVPNDRLDPAKGRTDWWGVALVTLGLGTLVYGLIEAGSAGFDEPRVIASLVGGVIGLVAFVVAEGRVDEPMMPLALFRSRTFTGANILTLFLYAALSGLLFFLPFNLINVQGYTATMAGAALLPFVITMFLLSRWAGGLVDRYGSKLPLVVGPFVTAIGFALFMIPGADASSYWTGFFPGVMVMSLGMTTAVAPLSTTVMTALEEKRAGIASGINNAVARTASLLAVALFGLVMLTTFDANLDERLGSLTLSTEQRRQLAHDRDGFASVTMPAGIDAPTRAALEASIRESFVAGFRVVAALAAALAAASAVAAWLLIDGRPAIPPSFPGTSLRSLPTDSSLVSERRRT
jgi:EmrB/QacA subfamily drug resistance transporter